MARHNRAYLREQRDRWTQKRKQRFLKVNQYDSFAVERMKQPGIYAHRDPWDCGSRCLMCHGDKFLQPRRVREKRAWQAVENVAW